MVGDFRGKAYFSNLRVSINGHKIFLCSISLDV